MREDGEAALPRMQRLSGGDLVHHVKTFTLAIAEELQSMMEDERCVPRAMHLSEMVMHRASVDASCGTLDEEKNEVKRARDIERESAMAMALMELERLVMANRPSVLSKATVGQMLALHQRFKKCVEASLFGLHPTTKKDRLRWVKRWFMKFDEPDHKDRRPTRIPFLPPTISSLTSHLGEVNAVRLIEMTRSDEHHVPRGHDHFRLKFKCDGRQEPEELLSVDCILIEKHLVDDLQSNFLMDMGDKKHRNTTKLFHDFLNCADRMGGTMESHLESMFSGVGRQAQLNGFKEAKTAMDADDEETQLSLIPRALLALSTPSVQEADALLKFATKAISSGRHASWGIPRETLPIMSTKRTSPGPPNVAELANPLARWMKRNEAKDVDKKAAQVASSFGAFRRKHDRALTEVESEDEMNKEEEPQENQSMTDGEREQDSLMIEVVEESKRVASEISVESTSESTFTLRRSGRIAGRIQPRGYYAEGKLGLMMSQQR